MAVSGAGEGYDRDAHLTPGEADLLAVTTQGSPAWAHRPCASTLYVGLGAGRTNRALVVGRIRSGSRPCRAHRHC